MADECDHVAGIQKVTPSALGCEECLKTGSMWVHLRLCRTCGHVGCCDSSPNRHATKHFHATGHPIIEGYDPTSRSRDAAQRPDPAVRLRRRLIPGRSNSREVRYEHASRRGGSTK